MAIQIRMGGYGPATTGFSRALKLIGDRLQAQFGDRVDIKYVWNIMDLGYRAEDILWLVEHGLLTLGYQSSSYLTDRVPELGLVDLPFLFQNTGQARAAIDGELESDAGSRKIEERVDYRILGFFENGFRHISNRTRAIRTPARPCRPAHPGAAEQGAGANLRAPGRRSRCGSISPRRSPRSRPARSTRRKIRCRTPSPTACTSFTASTRSPATSTSRGRSSCIAPASTRWPHDLAAAMHQAVEDAIAFQRDFMCAKRRTHAAPSKPTGGEIVELTAAEHDAFVAGGRADAEGSGSAVWTRVARSGRDRSRGVLTKSPAAPTQPCARSRVSRNLAPTQSLVAPCRQGTPKASRHNVTRGGTHMRHLLTASFMAGALAWRLALPAAQDEKVVPVEKAIYHWPVFSNEHVMVLRVVFPPGRGSNYHLHSLDQISVLVEAAPMKGRTWARRRPWGTGTRGNVSFTDYSKKPFTHRSTNKAQTPFHNVVVALLRPQPSGFAPAAREVPVTRSSSTTSAHAPGGSRSSRASRPPPSLRRRPASGWSSTVARSPKSSRANPTAGMAATWRLLLAGARRNTRHPQHRHVAHRARRVRVEVARARHRPVGLRNDPSREIVSYNAVG